MYLQVTHFKYDTEHENEFNVKDYAKRDTKTNKKCKQKTASK